MYDQRTQKMNVWVFLDIFHNLTWACIFGTVLVLAMVFALAESLLWSDENLTLFDSLCVVVFNVTQLGYNYKVKKRSI